MTFRQATELNAHVRKGQKGSLVVYTNAITRTEEDGAGEEEERMIPYMKVYTVFNVEQIEGLPEIYYAEREVTIPPVERIGTPRNSSWRESWGALRWRPGLLQYRRRLHPRYLRLRRSAMPQASVQIWRTKPRTGSGTLPALTAPPGRKSWGDEGYARKELVAELASAFPERQCLPHAGSARRPCILHRRLAYGA